MHIELCDLYLFPDLVLRYHEILTQKGDEVWLSLSDLWSQRNGGFDRKDARWDLGVVGRPSVRYHTTEMGQEADQAGENVDPTCMLVFCAPR